MSLPQFQGGGQSFQLMQSAWASLLDPVLANPMVNGIQIKGIVLTTGVNTINHLLSRALQGWFITDQNASAAIYRTLPFNNKTLTLTSSAPVTINLWVY